MKRRRGRREVDDFLRIALWPAVDPAHAHHGGRRRDVQPAVPEGEAVRVGQIAQDDFRFGATVFLGQGDDFAPRPPRYQQNTLRADGHQPRAGES